jgi:hypothetical protein
MYLSIYLYLSLYMIYLLFFLFVPKDFVMDSLGYFHWQFLYLEIIP